MRWIVAWNSSILICLDWVGSVRCGVAWRGVARNLGPALQGIARQSMLHGMAWIHTTWHECIEMYISLGVMFCPCWPFREENVEWELWHRMTHHTTPYYAMPCHTIPPCHIFRHKHIWSQIVTHFWHTYTSSHADKISIELFNEVAHNICGAERFVTLEI